MDRAVRGTPLRGDSGLVRIKEDQMSSEEAEGSKEYVGLSWSLVIDLIYSCKCLESSRALTGSLSFFSAMWHCMGSSSFWSWALCHFPRGSGGLELKSLHQSTRPCLTSSALGVYLSRPVQAQKCISILILQFTAPSLPLFFECSWGWQVPFLSVSSLGTRLTLPELRWAT